MSHTKLPRGKQGRMDCRIHFVKQCLIQKITDDVTKANAWFISNNAHTMTTDEALIQFKEWMK